MQMRHIDIRPALKSQYHAALKTLRQTIETCPDALWNDPADGATPFWRVAYHALFVTHMYLQPSVESFRPWDRHRPDADVLDRVTWENNRLPRPCEPYTRDDLLEYWNFVDSRANADVDALDLSAPQCGFPWYKMPTLEHQIVNIRHIQHHAAMLSGRLKRAADIRINWVGGDA